MAEPTKNKGREIPRISRWILGRFLFPYVEVSLPGDLEEEFREQWTEKGLQRARAWYRRQAVKSLPIMLKNIIFWGSEMFKNYLKIAFRNIRKHKGYSAINIAGLAVGMACTLLILLWVQDELSFDRFHVNADRIFRVVQNINFSDHSTTWAITQGPLGPSLEKDIPEIETAVRTTRLTMRVRIGDKRFEETGIMADGSLFSVFTFPLVKGEAAAAFADPHVMVLSEDVARKFFPGEDPIGRTVQLFDQTDFRVTGVIKNIPANSSLQFGIAVPFIYGRELNYSVDNWGNSQFGTWVQLKKGVSRESVLPKVSGHLKGKPTLEKDSRLDLQPLKAIHLRSRVEFEGLPQGDIASVRIFSLVAFFILLIACINFMNLTTARSANRAKEVGLRKVAGAHRSQLILQFFGESLLLTAVAVGLSLILVKGLLPPFNTLAAKTLSFGLFKNVGLLAGLAGLVFLTGIIAGSYPALFLSTFQPAKVLKGSAAAGSRGKGFRRVLVVFQFSLTILLLVCTAFVSRQLHFMRNYDLGYDKEHVVLAGMPGEIRNQFDAFKGELLRNPDIQGVAAGSNPPTNGYQSSNSLWDWEGRNSGQEILMRSAFADEDYFKVLGLEISQGRAFSRESDFSKSPAFVINEEAARIMAMKEPVGQLLSGLRIPKGPIVGVVKDFYFMPLRGKIDPLILIYNPSQSRVLFVKIGGADIPRTIETIGKTWKNFAPNSEFRFRFLDEALDALYRAEERTGTIFRCFSALAVLISCLGLFGLASFMAEQRTREIGIRKVLGASISGLVGLFSKEFTKWVLTANLLAWPIAYFAVVKWLQGYAVRIKVGAGPFLSAAVLSTLIALLTVSYHSIRSARANPAEAIRYE
jgi:putative ABC transport system permease protein